MASVIFGYPGSLVTSAANTPGSSASPMSSAAGFIKYAML
jgi:hypothetical protein